ncbi:ISNCY family transposase, partial [Propionivibrio sp.]|uniref:ISNCY family transposase n=1 Tax=Propionivibrio sp. TaxID=2212460 RepID=UPI003BF1F74E
MCVVQNSQMHFGEVDISKMVFDPKSRDDIPKILRGLQFVYTNIPLRTSIFELLESRIAPKVSKATGRPGMPLWTILVCGTIRLDLNCDYDRLHELVNHHNTLRAMLGHGAFDDLRYHYQTLKDNVGLLTPELLGEINERVVQAGHVLVKKKDGEALRGRCDSFVLETNVHFPTDINLLFDAMRKTITLTAQWCDDLALTDWRQHEYNLRHVKRLMRTAQNKKRSKATSPERAEKNEALIIAAHQDYLTVAQTYLDKARQTLTMIEHQGLANVVDLVRKFEIEGFMAHADRQIDQIRRRVILGEVIAHDEKVFSIFEPHTEWISKGKAGVPVELGVKVCIVEDQYQFILHHHVMQKQTDDQVAVAMVTQAQKRFPNLNACSFDKGFHSPANQIALKEHLDLVVLPRKGRLSKQAQEEEQAEAFVKARRAHSAVESAINGLEVHGLDVCPDHGIDGFKRYVALAVLARNIHRIGEILWQQDKKREQRKTH